MDKTPWREPYVGPPPPIGMGPTYVSAQMPDGVWLPAQTIGWQEEHGWLARLIFWLRRLEHCNDREGQRRARWWQT